MDDQLRQGRWFAVRCIFSDSVTTPVGSDQNYEERITIWQAGSQTEAIELAEAEAQWYAATISDDPSRYLGLAQCYELYDRLGPGAEVFSLFRTSRLGPDAYLDAFFDTGQERQRPVGASEC